MSRGIEVADLSTRAAALAHRQPKEQVVGTAEPDAIIVQAGDLAPRMILYPDGRRVLESVESIRPMRAAPAKVRREAIRATAADFYGTDALPFLHAVITNADENVRTRIAAAKELREAGLGSRVEVLIEQEDVIGICARALGRAVQVLDLTEEQVELFMAEWVVAVRTDLAANAQ